MRQISSSLSIACWSVGNTWMDKKYENQNIIKLRASGNTIANVK